jgi:hypothetical protein
MNPLIITQINIEQLAFYHENGYLSVDRVASDEEIAEIRTLYDRMFASRTGRSVGDISTSPGPTRREKSRV